MRVIPHDIGDLGHEAGRVTWSDEVVGVVGVVRYSVVVPVMSNCSEQR